MEEAEKGTGYFKITKVLPGHAVGIPDYGLRFTA
jgi:hypothetical protein